MFKKPNRNFRSRKNRDSESGDDNVEGNGGEAMEREEKTPIIVPASTFKKKKKKQGLAETTIKATSKLSFGDDENEELIKVKKSSRSKHIAKQIKKESRREQEEAKKEALKRAVEQQIHKNGSNMQEAMDIDDDDETENNTNSFPDQDYNISNFSSVPKRNKSPTSRSRSESEDSEEEREAERKKRISLDKIFKDGAIPDAHMIHMARKKRQAAREHGDFIPLEEKERPSESGSRLIREEDHDRSDDDDEPLSFSVESREKQLRKMQETILTAQESRSSEESDQEREWEEQQIRKGVSIPQVVTNDDKGNTSLAPGLTPYDQYMYSQSSNIFNPNAPDMSHMAGSAPTIHKAPSDLPLSLDNVKRNLQDRLDSLTSVHRAHMNEREDMIDRLKTCEESIAKCEGSQSGLEDQYRFYQEMRGYVRDLVECLNEKVPSINYLDRSMTHHLKIRAENLVKRRQEDLKDQSEDIRVQQNLNLPPPPIPPEKQRRIAEREARRSRRRRKRDGQEVKDHHEGLSTDDEESQGDMSKYKLAKEQIQHDCRTMFEDVNEEFCRLSQIRRRFEEWKYKYSSSYSEAYIGLCLPKLFTPFVKLELVLWNPIENARDVGLESMSWYESLMFYGHRQEEEINASDTDIKLIPSLIEKVLLPKLTERVEKVWDPLSANQTIRLSKVAKQLIRDYPSITADSKNTQNFLRTLVHRLRKTLSDDVYIPLCSKQVMDNKNSPAYVFFQRQFWTCIKLLTNLMVWHGMLSDKVLKELTLDSLLNRYLLLALQTSLHTQTTPDVLYKTQAVVCCLPKPWFVDISSDSTLHEFTMLCRFLNTFADTLASKATAGSDTERKDARDNLRQITKMFVSMHAMDHAVALTEKFSFKM